MARNKLIVTAVFGFVVIAAMGAENRAEALVRMSGILENNNVRSSSATEMLKPAGTFLNQYDLFFI